MEEGVLAWVTKVIISTSFIFLNVFCKYHRRASSSFHCINIDKYLLPNFALIIFHYHIYGEKKKQHLAHDWNYRKESEPKWCKFKGVSESKQEKLCFPPTVKYDQNDLIMNIFMFKLWSVYISLCRYNYMYLQMMLELEETSDSIKSKCFPHAIW